MGAGAIAWGLFVLPIFRQEAAARSVARKLVEGESYRLQTMVDQIPGAEKAAERSFCNPVALHSVFVLHLFVLNESIAVGNQMLSESSYAPVYNAARRALACAPADSFIWLTLFWLDVGKNGLDRSNTNYLRLSYALSRNEAWISLWRSRLVFLLSERLSPDVSREAVDEFIKLLKTRSLYVQTASIFENASPVTQTRIIEQLQTVGIDTQRAFARALLDKGIDIKLPDVNLTEPRP
jgi:hypothetical protein